MKSVRVQEKERAGMRFSKYQFMGDEGVSGGNICFVSIEDFHSHPQHKKVTVRTLKR